MALTAADLTRIYQYGAYTLGDASGELTTPDVLDLIQSQIDSINAIDLARGTTFATQIQTDLARLDALDRARNAAAEDGGIKVLGGTSEGIEYFPGGVTTGYTREFGIIKSRIARVLSQSIGAGEIGITYSYRA